MTPAATEFRATVITPVYNGRGYIAETIESVLAQREEKRAVPFDYIVVDDGSTDGTGDFVAGRYGDRLRLIRQPNQGEPAAVNRGIAEASTDIVGIVNADDPIRPDLVRVAVHALESNPDFVAIYPDWEMIDAVGAIVQTIRASDFDLRMHLEQHLCLPGPGAFFRRSALRGELARDPRWRYTGDYEMWLRLALRGRIVHIPRVLATWRRHSAGASQAARTWLMASNKVDMIEAFFRRPDLPADVRALERQAMSSALYCAALLAIHGPTVPARRYMWRSVSLSAWWPTHFAPVRRRSWIRIAYVIALPASYWVYRFAKWLGVSRPR